MAQINNARFRGCGVAVDPNDSLEGLLSSATLNWTTARRDMLIQGKESTRPSQFKALCRSDDGFELGVATAEYKPIHNRQIVESMKRIADAGEMTITHLGSLDHGRRVFASVNMNGCFDLKPTGKQLTPERALAIHGQSWDSISADDRAKLDRTELHGIMGSGHVPGISFTFDGWAERLVCLNGAKISRSAKSRFSMRHVLEFDRNAENRLHECIREIKREFSRYQESAERLRSAVWTPEATRAFACELLAPQFFREALERGLGTGVHPSLVGAARQYSLDEVLQKTGRYLQMDAISSEPSPRSYSLDDVLNQMDRNEKRETEKAVKITRPATRVLELVNAQPGADLAEGTAWNAYNAVTYYVDHERGRGESSAVESSLFGEGAGLKQDALELALAYSEVMYA